MFAYVYLKVGGITCFNNKIYISFKVLKCAQSIIMVLQWPVSIHLMYVFSCIITDLAGYCTEGSNTSTCSTYHVLALKFELTSFGQF